MEAANGRAAPRPAQLQALRVATRMFPVDRRWLQHVVLMDSPGLIACSDGSRILLLDPRNAQELLRWRCGSDSTVSALGADNCAPRMAAGFNNGDVSVWSVTGQQEGKTLRHRGRVEVISLRGDLVAASTNPRDSWGQVIVSSVSTGAALACLDLAAERPGSIQLVDSGRFLVVHGSDKAWNSVTEVWRSQPDDSKNLWAPCFSSSSVSTRRHLPAVDTRNARVLFSGSEALELRLNQQPVQRAPLQTLRRFNGSRARCGRYFLSKLDERDGEKSARLFVVDSQNPQHVSWTLDVTSACVAKRIDMVDLLIGWRFVILVGGDTIGVCDFSA